ncbi:hypothetical protein [Clostridium butyricum]|uniref:hypothetical protein n=1 Tax=Clostridium butyricum TaxID=1492 RepID=UPI00090394D9|nr:hypothetical protein [Clostridium butyricum]APF21106.1 hypothetical protein NPD4_3582 [Clostridium butyricum]
MLEVFNEKPLQEVKESKEKEKTELNSDIWDSISSMGEDIASLLLKIEELKTQIGKGSDVSGN